MELTKQSCIEEYWIIMDNEGNKTEQIMIFPIENRKNTQIPPWTYAYRFFDVPKTRNIDGSIEIDYNKRSNVSPLLKCEISKTELMNMSFEEFSAHLNQSPKQKTLTKTKKKPQTR